MALGDQWDIVQYPRFQQRVIAAAARAANDVFNEDVATPNHPDRASLAVRVINSPQSFMLPFALAIAAQGVGPLANDAEVATQIAAVWNTFAG